MIRGVSAYRQSPLALFPVEPGKTIHKSLLLNREAGFISEAKRKPNVRDTAGYGYPSAEIQG